ncbi:hypothetical protein GCM10010389_39930 [Streptomyces echinoruber]|uniref:non-specific serine/threonine protein kinase n=2 Tax=Streptomyces echinoruber TaxID=68898 RepID=A0A918RH42_9ACTN|nr:hypothetical protein GCM10010389_39930 [Streptomyces echinoruber]
MAKAHVSADGTRELVGGRYRLLEAVHRETNRVCWYAEDIQVELPCLVTEIGLPPGPGVEERITDHVMRTSAIVAELRPGRVAAAVDAVAEDGRLWIVTEWIDGTPLGELLDREGALEPERAARIGLALLDVLEAAHAEGVTHGELSPGQVFVREADDIVVTGFGLAGTTLAPRLTAPSYASPEQARDERIGPAADLWALGALLYTMVEGRPPFRDRGRPEATLRGVDRLPLRAPLRAGGLTRAVQGLLRKNSRERMTRPEVWYLLTRTLGGDTGGIGDAGGAAGAPGRWREAYAAACHAGPVWSRRTAVTVAGGAVALVAVAVAVLAAADLLPGTGGGSSAAGPAPRPPASVTVPPTGAGRDPSGTPPRASASATAALPAGYRVLRAPEGFSVALPKGFRRLRTSRVSDLAYRVVFGPGGTDARTLAVTYSTRVGPDPVAVWREDVEPDLQRTAGYRRLGDIRATTYLGRSAADMEWLSGTGDRQTRTFGRGFLLGGHRGFSLRWTTPAGDWGAAANRQALATFLKTFRPPA